MADPLLTSLCTICHVSTPRYKCPRCGIRTCSASCIKKHKAWSECSGARDPTVYKRRPELRTAAGVDHDYNFLHGMEVSMQRAEKHLVEDRGVVQQEELRPLTMQEVKWKTGRDGRKRKVVTTRLLREVKGRRFDRLLAARLKRLDIRIICAPMGMERHLDNKTTFHRKTQRINWQVEWISLQDESTENRENDAQPPRVLLKTLDDERLYRAYHAALEEQNRATGRLPRRQGKGPSYGVQNASNSTWFRGLTSLQEPMTGCWITQDPTDPPGPWPAELDEQLGGKWDFYLASPRQRSDEPKTVTVLQPQDCLSNILAGTNVLEFPTIYVLSRGQTLPEGFVIGPKDTAAPPSDSKRKDGPQGKGESRFSKKRKLGMGSQGKGDGGNGEDLEEGEVGSDNGEGDGHRQEDGTYQGALEAGEVLEEHSYGEEDDDDDDNEADTTSSSGSDSEDE